MPLDSFEPSSAADWLRHAKSDLALAKGPASPDVLFEALCFHAQQAAEKSMKAVLIHHSIEFPFTHSIARLITIVKEQAIPWPDTLNEAADLTDYAVQMRYPGAHAEVSKEDYEQAVVTAEQVFTWAERLILGCN